MSLRNKFRIAANPAQCYKAMKELGGSCRLRPGFACVSEHNDDDWEGLVWAIDAGGLEEDAAIVEAVKEAFSRSPVNTVLVEKIGD